MIDEEHRAEIRRLHNVEKWKVGTIGSELGVHPDTVKNALAEKPKSPPKKASLINPYILFLEQTLKDHPRLTATRLFQMVQARGYTGSVYPVRRAALTLRPKEHRAYQDLHFFPGEVAQVDWADFGDFEVAPGKRRRLSLFGMILAYSRKLYGKFFFNQKMGSLLEAHVLSFRHFGGNPKIIVYDNMKTAVIKNMGKGIQFNEGLIQLSSHYHFKLRACNPRSGWEKGRIERAFRYVRDNFSPESRQYGSIEQLNDQFENWLVDTSDQRPWVDDTCKIVSDAFKEEDLLNLAGDSFPYYEEKRVRVTKKSMINFDCNSYSVPPEYVASWLTVLADSESVSVQDGTEEIANHKRCWSKEEKVVIPSHIDAIVKQAKARSSRMSKHLTIRQLKRGDDLIRSWASIGESLSRQSNAISELINGYGMEIVDLAVEEALESKTPRADSIARILSRSPENMPKSLPQYSRKELNKFEVTSHDLSSYD